MALLTLRERADQIAARTPSPLDVLVGRDGANRLTRLVSSRLRRIGTPYQGSLALPMEAWDREAVATIAIIAGHIRAAGHRDPITGDRRQGCELDPRLSEAIDDYLNGCETPPELPPDPDPDFEPHPCEGVALSGLESGVAHVA